MSSAMCSVLMYCGPRRGGPSLYSMIHREGRPPRGPQCFGAHVLRSARRRTLPKQYDSPGGTTSVSSAMYSVLMYCGPRGGGPYPVQYDSPGGTTSVSSAMCLGLMYCGPHGGGPSPIHCRGIPNHRRRLPTKKPHPFGCGFPIIR